MAFSRMEMLIHFNGIKVAITTPSPKWGVILGTQLFMKLATRWASHTAMPMTFLVTLFPNFLEAKH